MTLCICVPLRQIPSSGRIFQFPVLLVSRGAVRNLSNSPQHFLNLLQPKQAFLPHAIQERALASSSSSSSSSSPKHQQPAAVGLAANQLQIGHVPRLSQHLRRGEGVGGGPSGRASWLRRCVSALVAEERIELPWPVALETRLYAERLIQEAVRAQLIVPHLSSFQDLEELLQPPWNEEPEVAGLLELAAFWLQKPELVTKLLKVLVPRYRAYNRAYTRMFRLQRPPHPSPHASISQGFGVLELHGNPWPPIGKPHLPKRVGQSGTVSLEPFKDKYLINVLVSAAREAAEEEARERRAKAINSEPPSSPTK